MADFESFCSLLKQKEALPLTSELKGFLAKFAQGPVQNQRKSLSLFLESIVALSLENPAFVGSDKTLVVEGWEKLLLSKVYDKVFGAPGSEETRSNIQLGKKMETFKWIEERHLDLDISFGLSLEVAQAELLRINGFKSPRDKLVIMQNVLQLVVDLIKKCSNESASNDAILPTLILVIVRAAPPNMISNVKYVMRFRHQADLDLGVTQYALTNMMSAVSFIYNMTPKSLTLNEEETKTWLPLEPTGSSPPKWRPSNNSFKPLPKPDVNKFAGQVTDFFGALFRDVKTSADEFATSIQQMSTQPIGPLPDPVRSSSRQSHSNSHSPEPRSDSLPRPQRSPEQNEDYELQLALALSLSEAQNLELSPTTKEAVLAAQSDLFNQPDSSIQPPLPLLPDANSSSLI